ncbi:hypothetical protein [Enterococcus faecalis]|uniref:hypothetical protein n=1 Tax=Enterococcus faecalis TaxID=1351 RepID=UPI00242AD4C5|nr:hypothetical protein [Enterococcus faecalis]MEB5927571.1 hypothetical protein [Enterococcus faecalis]
MESGFYLKVLPFGVFFVFSIFYLNCLKKLNEILLDTFSNKSAFDLLGYNDYQPIKMFALALLLVISSLGLLYFYVKNIRFDACIIIEVIVYVSCVIGILIIDGMIIKNISIPILRAILGTMLVGGIFIGAFDSK